MDVRSSSEEQLDDLKPPVGASTAESLIAIRVDVGTSSKEQLDDFYVPA